VERDEIWLLQQVARNKEKLLPGISLTQEVTDRSPIKNNSPVITPQVSRRGMVSFQGL